MTSSSSMAAGTGLSSSTSVNLPPQQEVPFLTAVEVEVFRTVVENYKIHGQFLRDDAISLSWTFGPPILQVLEMIDEDSVTILKSPASGKVIVQVYGRSGELYWVPPGRSMCQCPAYFHGKKEYCKHVLAAHFMLAIAPIDEYEDISEQELAQVFNEHFKCKS